ncbi:MAG: phytanoyl-CoA dioxygenase family protein [Pseudomonadota bacterium]|nr:phytanoyl-CoA dioxygenase family protein [Pseudomonadota bacterium]
MTAPPSPQLQMAQLGEQGFVVIPRFVAARQLASLKRVAGAQLLARTAPLEREADLRYPGAPPSRSAEGGDTIRRLLDAYGRDPIFARFATARPIRDWMKAYFGEPVRMSRVHHNCLMTKHPRFGSMTGWHRDIRYWSFARENLVSVWLALGEETVENGALWFVPGSHRVAFDADRFDAAKFFRSDLPDNVKILSSAVSPRLAPGDAVFFHSNTLHSADRNRSDDVKLSLVYTYHGASNRAEPGTRSASSAEVDLTAAP